MHQSSTKHKLVALQLVGSPTSKFFFDLSLLYAKKVVQPDGFTLLFAIAHPDGSWAVSENIEQINSKITLSEMIEQVRVAAIVVPHLFCPIGLTSLRIFFEEVLDIPMAGSSGHVLGIAQNKQLTKLLAADAGIRVPKGIRLTKKASNSTTLALLQFPLIVKPNSADNSDGLALVQQRTELDHAIETAFHFDEEVLVEEYIAGRELRGAIIEENDEYHILPFIEYAISEKHPIRQREDKL